MDATGMALVWAGGFSLGLVVGALVCSLVWARRIR